MTVPLSPEEQKILQEIEKSFYEHDPQFSRKVSESTIYRVAGRNLKWLALGFVAGAVAYVLAAGGLADADIALHLVELLGRDDRADIGHRPAHKDPSFTSSIGVALIAVSRSPIVSRCVSHDRPLGR